MTKKQLTIPKLKKKKKRTRRQKANKDLWDLCKEYIRLTQPNICYTCGATGLAKSNWHTGHGINKGKLPVEFQYDVRNLRSQCYNCNVNLGGDSQVFIAKLEREKDGLKFLKEACRKMDGRWEVKFIPINKKLTGIDATIFLEKQIKILEKNIKDYEKNNIQR